MTGVCLRLQYAAQVLGASTNDPLKKQHEEIEQLFKVLCMKLDALSNYHFAARPVRVMG